MVEKRVQTNKTTIILTPNRSASWKQIKWVLISMASFVMIIAVAWSFVGAWVILPFAGLEIGLLTILMIKVNRFTHQQQVITFAQRIISVETGVERPHSRLDFERASALLRVTEPEHSMDKAKLHLLDQHSSMELGAFLNQDDCQLAREALKSAGLFVCSNKWWRSAP